MQAMDGNVSIMLWGSILQPAHDDFGPQSDLIDWRYAMFRIMQFPQVWYPDTGSCLLYVPSLFIALHPDVISA